MRRKDIEIKSHGWADILYIGLGLAAVIIGAMLVVDGAVALAEDPRGPCRLS